MHWQISGYRTDETVQMLRGGCAHVVPWPLSCPESQVPLVALTRVVRLSLTAAETNVPRRRIGSNRVDVSFDLSVASRTPFGTPQMTRVQADEETAWLFLGGHDNLGGLP